MDISKEIKIVTQELKNDPELYNAYQANIAMAFYDEYNKAIAEAPEGKSHKRVIDIANDAAKKFLDLWIEPIDEIPELKEIFTRDEVIRLLKEQAEKNREKFI